MTREEIEYERIRFQRHYENKNFHGLDFERNDEGFYKDNRIAWGFSGWLAAKQDTINIEHKGE